MQDIADANEELAKMDSEQYYPCCGKTICKGCVYSFIEFENYGKCPFCNSDRADKTDVEMVGELSNRMRANDPASICLLATNYHYGLAGLQQDRTKSMELFTKSAELGCSQANFFLGRDYNIGGDSKKAKFHYEAAAMAGHEIARSNLGALEYDSGNRERGVKHWIIAASCGNFCAMDQLRILFEFGAVSRESIDSTLKAYNDSCAEVRSEARDAFIGGMMIESMNNT
jgi:TPR repeat protein